jgi:hypothetical protein
MVRHENLRRKKERERLVWVGLTGCNRGRPMIEDTTLTMQGGGGGTGHVVATDRIGMCAHTGSKQLPVVAMVPPIELWTRLCGPRAIVVARLGTHGAG